MASVRDSGFGISWSGFEVSALLADPRHEVGPCLGFRLHFGGSGFAVGSDF